MSRRLNRSHVLNRSRVLNRSLAFALAAFLACTLGAGSADADISKAVQKKFGGTIIVTEDAELATTFENDADQIAAYKKANLKVISGVANEEGAKTWTFFVMAFMKKKPGVKEISLDFYRIDGKKKIYSANKRLSGIDPSLPLLSTRISLSEDDGLDAKRTYLVKLTAKRGKREIVLAQTKLTTK